MPCWVGFSSVFVSPQARTVNQVYRPYYSNESGRFFAGRDAGIARANRWVELPPTRMWAEEIKELIPHLLRNNDAKMVTYCANTH